MKASHLRVYYGPSDDAASVSVAETQHERKTVTVPVTEILPLLADAVEAASRTLDDPKPARIENLIQRIINDRFGSGELNQCPLTLKDLARIRGAFAQVLIASFHHRVVYPTSPAEKKGA